MTDSSSASGETSDKKGSSGLVFVAAFYCLVVTLLQSLVVPAIPQFPAELNTTPTVVSWLVTSTLLAGCIATPVFGKLGDLLPRRSVMLFTMSMVLIGSIIAPLGGIVTVLIGRTLQGIGTSLIPVAMAEVRLSLPPKRVGGALATISAMLGVGGGLGVPLGGLILGVAGWRAMFWFAAILALMCIVLIVMLLPKDQSAPGGAFDFVGAILLSLGLSGILIAISQGEAWGWGSFATIAVLLGGVIFLVIWGLFELRFPQPLVNLRTTLRRPILLTNLATILFGIMMFTNLLLTTLELQNPRSEGGFEWAPQYAGLAMLPSVVTMFLVAPMSTRIAERFSPRAVVLTGAAITLIGYLGRLFIDPYGGFIVLWATVVAFGTGTAYAGLPMMIFSYAPPEESGSANAVNSLMRSIGMASSSAIVGAVTAAMAVTYGDLTIPSGTGLSIMSWVNIIFGLLAGVMISLAR